MIRQVVGEGANSLADGVPRIAAKRFLSLDCIGLKFLQQRFKFLISHGFGVADNPPDPPSIQPK
jgi:hypothetical protein